jgi:hypothetical protein
MGVLALWPAYAGCSAYNCGAPDMVTYVSKAEAYEVHIVVARTGLWVTTPLHWRHHALHPPGCTTSICPGHRQQPGFGKGCVVNCA